MELTAEQYQSAVRCVLSVLNRFDLLGLEPGRAGGAPDGEYSAEAAALVRVMVKNGEIDFDQVRRTWLEWLGDDLSRLPKAVVDDLVRQLNEELKGVGVEEA